MSSIAAIFKAARREDAQKFVEEIFECLKLSKCKSDSLRLTRKYYMKIVQRAGWYFIIFTLDKIFKIIN